MASGAPDFHRELSESPQLASRLAEGYGISALSRTGAWLFREDFQGTAIGARWTETLSGGTMAVDTTQAYRGNQSFKITTAAVGASAPSATRVCYTRSPLSRKIGFDVCFLFGALSANSTFAFELSFALGVNQPSYKSGIRIDNASGSYSMDYWAFFGAYQALLSIPSLVAGWHHFKFVLDTQKGTYANLIIDGEDVSAITGLAGNQFQPTAAPTTYGCHINPLVRLTTNVATAETLNLDELIVSVDEP